jgi:regulator of sigma D
MGNIYYKVLEENIFQKPIDYVSFKENDFEGFEVTRETFGVPENQKLTDVIFENKLYPQKSDTTIINSSVGEGKSYLAIKTALNYIRHPSYKGKHCVIFVAPHKSLIKQYTSKFAKFKFPIPDYEKLIDEEVKEGSKTNINNINVNYKVPLHVVTVDCLLGDSGEAIEQQSIKRKYIENIINHGKQIGGKIVLIFDEIHEAIDNFEKPELIYNLWKFKTSNVLHKVFVLSATFNEASKTVIKHIARLTDKKIHIIETFRNQITNNLSDLHLHITEQSKYDFETEEFIKLFTQIIDSHEYINILSYSKSLASQIASQNSTISNLLRNNGKSINLSVADYNDVNRKDYQSTAFVNSYLSSYCNIGTMFKTGISIEHLNSALVIILPSTYAIYRGVMTKSFLGIFQNGIIDLIQALARVRKKSDIYVIMPTPQMLIMPSPSLEEYGNDYNYMALLPKLEILNDALHETKLYESLREENNWDYYTHSYDEFSFSMQKELIKKQYEKEEQKVIQEIVYAETKQEEGLPPLEYPSIENYTLKKGERILKSYYAIFGKDLSAYMIWASFNNQFVNCKLKSVSFLKEEVDSEDTTTVQDIFMHLFLKNMNVDLIENCDYQIYENFFNLLKQQGGRRLNNLIKIRSSNKKLHLHIMAFIQKSLKGNALMNKKYYQEDSLGHIVDIPFEAKDYLLCCITNAIQYKDEELTPNSSIELITAYKHLEEIRTLFFQKFIRTTDEGMSYIFRKFENYNTPFSNLEIEDIITSVKTIVEKDNYFSVFGKLRNVDFNNKNEAIKLIYTLLINTFFERQVKSQREPTAHSEREGRRNRYNIDYVIEKPLPQKRTGINLLYRYKYNRAENYEDIILQEEKYYEDYYNSLDINLDIENIPTTIIKEDLEFKIIETQ